MSGKTLIFIVAYNHEKTIQDVLTRIPSDLLAGDVEILVIDDASKDATFEKASAFQAGSGHPKLTVLINPVNQGYGGNQKIGYQYAIRNGFDAVALVHGDGQYAPEELPRLLAPVLAGEAEAVFGSRMLTPYGALRGGMPLYKFIGNKILTGLQNFFLRSRLSEFHSGYRIYSVAALKQIPFHLNSNDFHFDTQIIIQLIFARMRIKELPIPTYYGDEICNVDGLKYAKNVMRETLAAWLQKYGLGYQFRYDVRKRFESVERYESKLDFASSHTAAVNAVPAGSRVLDIGASGGHVAAALKAKGCAIVGIDREQPPNLSPFESFHVVDLNSDALPSDLGEFDRIFLLDVIEHITDPEDFVMRLYERMSVARDCELIVSTGNVAFLLMRLALLFGQFNYGPRGILDLTHHRLFTSATLRRLFEERGFETVSVQGIPAPFPLALGRNAVSRLLLILNAAAIAVLRGVFSYQMMYRFRARPSLDGLLNDAQRSANEMAQQIAAR